MAGAPVLLAQLRRIAVLADLTDSELALFASQLEEVSLARGDYLFHEGDPGDGLFLLVSGVLVAERALGGSSRERKDLAILPPSSCVGEMALADRAPRSASVRAELPCRALRLAGDRFEALMRDSPAIALKLFRAFFAEASRRLRVTNEQLIAVYEVGKLTASATEPREVAETILASLEGRLGAGQVVVALYEADSNQLRIARGIGPRASGLEGKRIPLDGGLPARAFDEKHPLLVERLLGASEPWESESMVLAPLVGRSSALGLLLVGAREGSRPYTVADLTLVTAVANISASVLRDAFVAAPA